MAGDVHRQEGDVGNTVVAPVRRVQGSGDRQQRSTNFIRGCLEAAGNRLKVMAAGFWGKLKAWLQEIEMGVVWGMAGISIIVFVFVAIWFIDPALLTLVLQFRQAECVTKSAEFLVGISNCSWTSCRLGCTREVYKCWQIEVDFEFISGTRPFSPPWGSLAEELGRDDAAATAADITDEESATRLYPNVRGCGYPPDLNCEDFYEKYGVVGGDKFDCWVSTIDQRIAMTELNLERAKREVILSLVPLFIFIVSVLYAFCRLGVFSVCNPFRLCPRAAASLRGTGQGDSRVQLPSMTPKKLFDYKKDLLEKKSQALASFQAASATVANSGAAVAPETSASAPPPAAMNIPDTIEEGDDENSSSRNSLENSSKKMTPENLFNDEEESPFSSSTTTSKPQQRSSNRGAAFRPGDSFDSEMLDLREFDLDSDDIVSIWSMHAGVQGSGSASGKRGAVARRHDPRRSAGSSGRSAWSDKKLGKKDS